GYLHVMFPSLDWRITAMDISAEAVASTARAHYTMQHGLGKQSDELSQLIEKQAFMRADGEWILAEGIRNRVSVAGGDVLSSEFANSYRGFDAVFGQNYLIHMVNDSATRAFAALLGALRPGGALFVQGMDLDLRARLAARHGLTPVDFDLRDIHEE